MSVQLVSLNIERDRHLDRVGAFLCDVHPDVVCLQEVFEDHAERFTASIGGMLQFLPTSYQKRSEDGEAWGLEGIALISRLPIRAQGSGYYFRSHPEKILRSEGGGIEGRRKRNAQGYLFADVVDPGSNGSLRISTTHFTWTPNGAANDYQRADARELLRKLDGMPPMVLTGDFNVPRGHNDVYTLLLEKFADAVPRHYGCSLDPELHRAFRDPVEGERVSKFMVDYFFLSPGIAATDVTLRFGVSDHAAVTGAVDVAEDSQRDTSFSEAGHAAT